MDTAKLHLENLIVAQLVKKSLAFRSSIPCILLIDRLVSCDNTNGIVFVFVTYVYSQL